MPGLRFIEIFSLYLFFFSLLWAQTNLWIALRIQTAVGEVGPQVQKTHASNLLEETLAFKAEISLWLRGLNVLCAFLRNETAACWTLVFQNTYLTSYFTLQVLELLHIRQIWVSWTVQKGVEDPTFVDLKPVVVWYSVSGGYYPVRRRVLIRKSS